MKTAKEVLENSIKEEINSYPENQRYLVEENLNKIENIGVCFVTILKAMEEYKNQFVSSNKVLKPNGYVIGSDFYDVDIISHTPNLIEKARPVYFISTGEIEVNNKKTLSKITDDGDTETYEAKLRNQLTPLYGLPSMVLMLDKNPNLKPIIIRTAEEAVKSKDRIQELLRLIENKSVVPPITTVKVNDERMKESLFEKMLTWVTDDFTKGVFLEEYKNQFISPLEVNNKKPLSEITEDDAIEVAKLQGYNYTNETGLDIHFDIVSKNSFDLCIQHDKNKHDYYETVQLCTCQFLQSKGYELPQYYPATPITEVKASDAIDFANWILKECSITSDGCVTAFRKHFRNNLNPLPTQELYQLFLTSKE